MTNNRLLIPILIFVFVLMGAGAAEKNTRPLKGEEYQDRILLTAKKTPRQGEFSIRIE